jgi:hypothetical protein
LAPGRLQPVTADEHQVALLGLAHPFDHLMAGGAIAAHPAGSDFATYGGPLTELAMLGVIAINFPGTKLEWDTQNTQFPNCPEANQHVNPPYREGWSL